MATSRSLTARYGLKTATKSVVDASGILVDVGDIANLSTTDKTGIVSAVNELKGYFNKTLKGVDGTESSPSYSFATDPGLGLYRSADNQVSLAISGLERYRFADTEVTLLNSIDLVFDQGTYSGTLTAATLSADRTYTLPDVSGTLITTGDTGTITSNMIVDGTLVTELDDLTDVDVTTTPPNDGEALVWDDANSEWVPGSAGATAAGSANEIQYNDGASGLAASSDLTWDDTAKELGVGGDINLDDGGTYSTTLQMVTATANRTISFPDATGTVALVAGSNGQLIYNSAGAQAGLTSAIIGSTDEINISLAGTASTPPVSFTGSWFTGGTATTTKPQVLIEPTGTTSTAWSTNGTGLGVNAASGFTGNLLDLQLNGTSNFSVNSTGRLLVGTSSQSGGSLLQVNDDRIRIASSKTPASASDTGTAGEVCWDSDYIYVAVGTNTWKRAALSTW